MHPVRMRLHRESPRHRCGLDGRRQAMCLPACNVSPHGVAAGPVAAYEIIKKHRSIEVAPWRGVPTSTHRPSLSPCLPCAMQAFLESDDFQKLASKKVVTKVLQKVRFAIDRYTHTAETEAMSMTWCSDLVSLAARPR